MQDGKIPAPSINNNNMDTYLNLNEERKGSNFSMNDSVIEFPDIDKEKEKEKEKEKNQGENLKNDKRCEGIKKIIQNSKFDYLNVFPKINHQKKCVKFYL